MLTLVCVWSFKNHRHRSAFWFITAALCRDKNFKCAVALISTEWKLVFWNGWYVKSVRNPPYSPVLMNVHDRTNVTAHFCAHSCKGCVHWLSLCLFFSSERAKPSVLLSGGTLASQNSVDRSLQPRRDEGKRTRGSQTLFNPASKQTSWPTDDNPTELQTDSVDTLLLLVPVALRSPSFLSLSLLPLWLGWSDTKCSSLWTNPGTTPLFSHHWFLLCKIGHASLSLFPPSVSLCAGHQGIL